MQGGRRHDRKNTLEDTRAELAVRLRARVPEIEESILARVRAVDSMQQDNPTYASGQRKAVAEVLDYSLTGAEGENGSQAPIPTAVATQARRAAQIGIGLDTVLRRYMAAERCIGEFIFAEAAGLPADAVGRIIGQLGPHLDRLVTAVSAEYRHEAERIQRSPGQQLVEWVQGLLGGEEPVDGDRAKYRFAAWHLGMVVSGPGAAREVQDLAARLESQPLFVPRADDTAWVWLGRRRPIAFAEVKRQLSGNSSLGMSMAIGESRKDVAGWRLTHREAQAAQQVMVRQRQQLIRCGHVALTAALLQAELLADSLQRAYLLPLAGRGKSDKVLRETLRTYFTTGGNTAATASALDVSRHTVHRRLRTVERRLDTHLHTCQAELEVALRLEEMLDRSGPT